jgi:hypothetical protein
MAGIRGLYGDRAADGNRDFSYQDLVYLYFFSDDGISPDRLFYSCLLDEY